MPVREAHERPPERRPRDGPERSDEAERGAQPREKPVETSQFDGLRLSLVGLGPRTEEKRERCVTLGCGEDQDTL